MQIEMGNIKIKQGYSMQNVNDKNESSENVTHVTLAIQGKVVTTNLTELSAKLQTPIVSVLKKYTVETNANLLTADILAAIRSEILTTNLKEL